MSWLGNLLHRVFAALGRAIRPMAQLDDLLPGERQPDLNTPEAPARAPDPERPMTRSPILTLDGQTWRMMLVHEAERWLGVREQGENRGWPVELFQRALDGKAHGEPWCAAFVGFCVGQVDALCLVLTGAAGTEQRISEHVMTTWRRSPAELRRKLPEPGDLMVWQMTDREGAPTERGHIGIVTAVADDGMIHTIEGNTGSGEGVEREGDGVYRRVRHRAGQGRMKCIGFLRVWP